MKRSTLMLTGCAMLLAAASAAHSFPRPPHPGAIPPPPYIAPVPYSRPLVYLSLSGGLAMLNDAEIGDPAFYEIESDPGVAFSGAFGYGVCRFFRLETEIAYQQNDMDQVKIAGTSLAADIDGDTSSISGLFNGYVDFATPGPVTPFLSAGIGLAKVEASIDNQTWDDTALAWQVGAGVNIALNPALSVDLKYRCFATADLQLDNMDVDYASHNVYGGLRFAF